MSEIQPFTPRAVALPGELVRLCRRYLAHLQSRGYAEATVQAYRTDLQQAVGYLRSIGIETIQAVGSRHVDDWLTCLLDGEGVSARTASRKLESLRGLFRYAGQRDLIAHNPAAEISAPRYHADPVIAPPAETIAHVIDAIPDTEIGRRDRAMMLLMYDAALRCGGVASLDLHHADRPGPSVAPDGTVLYRSKGGMIRETCCGPDTVAAVDAWLAVRRHWAVSRRPTEALFLGRGGRRISRQTIYQRVRHWGDQADAPHLHPHMLRHRRIGDVRQAADIKTAQWLAGHSSAATTAQIYGDVPAARHRERIRQVPTGTEQQRRAA